MYDLMCIRFVIYYLNRIYKDLNFSVRTRIGGKNATVESSPTCDWRTALTSLMKYVVNREY